MTNPTDQFAAGEQALGYIYQIRLALLQMMKMSEETACCIEKDDDIDFSDPDEGKILASLKHKAAGDRLSDMCPDFWKSVRIWLTREAQHRSEGHSLTFFLFTTGQVAPDSFLTSFLPDAKKTEGLVQQAEDVLSQTKSKTLIVVRDQFNQLNPEQKQDFLSRITILDQQERIQEIPSKVIDRMRTVRFEFRKNVYERIEGWWMNACIDLLTGSRKEPLRSREISEMLASFSDQFKADNLPIDFRGKEPPEGVGPVEDERMFVRQLNELGLGTERIRRAILDYYRAFEQRASWAREHLTIGGEVEQYDDRLTDEWDRYRVLTCDGIDETSTQEAMVAAGKELLRWVETNDSPNLRIRDGVTEPYVMVGSYHMLANESPMPRVYWHPRFIDRLSEILSPEET